MEPHRLQIRYADLDTAGHVNNAIYLNYFEQGRMAFFLQKIGKQWDWNEHGIILARNEIDYLSPVFLEDEVYITSEFIDKGNKSFRMKMRIYKLGDKKEEIDCARGIVTIVCFNHKEKKTIPFPESWQKLLD